LWLVLRINIVVGDFDIIGIRPIFIVNRELILSVKKAIYFKEQCKSGPKRSLKMRETEYKSFYILSFCKVVKCPTHFFMTNDIFNDLLISKNKHTM